MYDSYVFEVAQAMSKKKGKKQKGEKRELAALLQWEPERPISKAGRMLALRLIDYRRELVALKKEVEDCGNVSDEQKALAQELLKSIALVKEALSTKGIDHREAALWAISATVAPRLKRPRTSETVASIKGAGIGMYGLGNSLRVWR